MFERIIDKINSAERIGIFGHINPDGDALGSIFSLKDVVESMGKCGEAYLSGSIEPSVFSVIQSKDEPKCRPCECDLLIALDCADADRLGEWKEDFINHPCTAAIDHHVTHQKFAQETVVQDISSNCEVLYGMYKEMGVSLSMAAASNLYIGIATDTGNFKYSSVSGDTHRVAAELIDTGVEFADISKKIFDTVTKEFLALQERAIKKLEFYSGGRVALLKLSEDDFTECGTDEAAASAIVTLPARILGVEVGVYIRSRNANEYKVSLRSVDKVDVASIAATFGGGGHIRAAGYSVEPNMLDENLKELISKIEEQL